MDEKKQIEQAQKKAQIVRNSVDNLLVLTIVINRDTGKVLDIVSKPSVCNDNITGISQLKIPDSVVISCLEKRGYTVTKIKT